MKSQILGVMIILVFYSFHTGCKKNGTAPGSTVNPPIETGTMVDIDGNEYTTVKIGNQWWMAENFKGVHDSDSLALIGTYSYNDDANNTSIYGRLYTWESALNGSPDGWHLPTQEDWQTLIATLGGTNVAGGKMKETGTAHWDTPNMGATNESGFTALGSGFRGPDGLYYELRKHADFWGATQNNTEPWEQYLWHNASNTRGESNPADKTSGIAFSVRYIQD